MNKSIVVEWYDDDNPESFVLINDAYGVKVIQAKPIDEARTELTVYGQKENIDKFIEDFDEGQVEPLETMQSGDYDDEDYVAYLNNEVNRTIGLMQLEDYEFNANTIKF